MLKVADEEGLWGERAAAERARYIAERAAADSQGWEESSRRASESAANGIWKTKMGW